MIYDRTDYDYHGCDKGDLYALCNKTIDAAKEPNKILTLLKLLFNQKFCIIDKIKTLKNESINDFILSVLNTTTDTISNKSMKKYKKNVIEIINTNSEFIKFNINLEERNRIIKDGYNSCDKFIECYQNVN